MKKIITLLLTVLLMTSLCACSSGNSSSTEPDNGKAVYKVGICNFVDDASLNQIVSNIKDELKAKESEYGVTFEIIEDNCNADFTVLDQIIANFIAENVDLMIGVATPVAMQMQAATEDKGIPVVFSAVSDPLGAGLVNNVDNPGSNITGTSDYLDTEAVMNLITALEPDIDNVGLLYDLGQDSSKTAIEQAKSYLDAKGIKYTEYNGTNTQEIIMAVDQMKTDGISACFTPSDNTIMTAELSIYEALTDAGIKHYAGADSFALNGAFVGYGVDYANLGKVTADMAADILVNEKDPGSYPVQFFDNGTATVNTEICEALGLDFNEVKSVFEPLCTKVVEITTAESFE
ncbi:MAG: ABC transporter substrate-binding protein [Erysipelotrichaceae bacterium]|nr:ABC transporter substrate-binding protein [Erysipelotrichaceae bacterium]